MYESSNLRNIPAVKYPVKPLVSQLVGCVNTPVAKDAAVHVEFDLIPDVGHGKFTAILFRPGFFHAIAKTQVLEVTLAGLVAHRAIERVVEQQKFNYGFPGFDDLGRGEILHHHAILYRCAAGSHQLGHRARVFGR